MKITAKCEFCQMTQYLAKSGLCRKCGITIPARAVLMIEHNNPEVDALLGRILPTAQQLEMKLIREAVARTGSIPRAAKLIGLGKTNLYRKLRENPA
jgi:DNA-binding phage protein